MMQDGKILSEPEIYQELGQLFHDVFDDSSIVLTPELTAKDVDDWDSLSHIRLVLAVEKAFQISFSAAEVGRLKNVAEFVELIRSKLSSSSRAD
jgi:acyl carrier protein